MNKLTSLLLFPVFLIVLSQYAKGQSTPNSTTNNNNVGANVYLSNLLSPTSVNQDLLPKTTNYYNLGNSSKTWKNLYVGGITATGNTGIAGNLSVTGLTTLKGLSVLGTLTGTTAKFPGGITGNLTGNATTVTNGVYTSGSYSNPSWITSLAISKITGIAASAPLSYSAGVFSISKATSASNGYLSSADWNTFNGKQGLITLTTTGNNGAATFNGHTLNIPAYSLSGLGGAPLNSPSFTGTPTAPTQPSTDNSTNLATTAFVTTAVSAISSSSSGWSLTGNSGTVDGTNFIGTIDNVPLNFRVNNQLSGRIESENAKANTFFGYQSGLNTVPPFGVSNTGVGWVALSTNTDGESNTAFGAAALFNNTIGGANTAIGVDAISDNKTGSFLTAIGFSTDVNADGYENSSAIGYQATIDASNEVVLGNSSIGVIKAAVTSITAISDRRFKKNINENVPGLEFIKLLRPVTYNYDIKGLNAHRLPNNAGGNGSGKMTAMKLSKEDEATITKKEKVLYSGLVAQEVEVAANKIGYNFSGLYKPQNDKDTYGLGYSDFVVPLIKATQELSASNDSLKSQVADLQNQLNEIKAMLAGQVKSGESSGTILSSAKLEQNVPNPFNHTTLINYYIPQTAGSAMIIVTGMNGQNIKTVPVNAMGSGQLTLQTAQLAAGTYAYSLYVDGNLIDTKKMVVGK